MLTDEKLREIRDGVDLVALISEYVPLRRSGARFVGLCPFHQEKTPSFGVSRGKSFYYCFGCQASGDAISFLRHVEGLSFMEAVEKLAERLGIEVPRTDDAGQVALRRTRERRERLAELMALAQAFYEQQLEAHPHAGIAQAELARRNVRSDVAHAFHLGYAPCEWDGLARHLAHKRVALEEAAEVGLVALGRNGGYYDRFRHRLMFPVADQHGRVIAFSGRALAPVPGTAAAQEAPAKYINSPEGPLYKKGHALFGLHAARQAIRKQNQALLCEGNFDLIALHQAGHENVVAPLGTAFTLEQARLLRRFTEEVVLVFDGDAAGRKAVASAHELLREAGLNGRAVRLPDGHDPDSFLSAHGPEAFVPLIENAPPVLSFLIDEASLHVTDAASRARIIQRLAPYFQGLDGVQLSAYVDMIVRKFLAREGRIPTDRHFRDVRNELTRALTQGALRRAGEHSAIVHANAQVLPSDHKVAPVRPKSDLPVRQRLALGALLDHPELFETPEAQRLAGLLTDPDLRAIFQVTAQMREQRGEVDAPSLLAELAGNAARAWLGEWLAAAPSMDLERARTQLIEGLPWLERDLRDKQRAQLSREIQIAYQTGDEARRLELTRLRDELAKT